MTRGGLPQDVSQYTSVNGFRKPQANSIYHAFTLRVGKSRCSQGLGLLVAYTGGKLIDDASQVVASWGRQATNRIFIIAAGSSPV